MVWNDGERKRKRERKREREIERERERESETERQREQEIGTITHSVLLSFSGSRVEGSGASNWC